MGEGGASVVLPEPVGAHAQHHAIGRANGGSGLAIGFGEAKFSSGMGLLEVSRRITTSLQTVAGRDGGDTQPSLCWARIWRSWILPSCGFAALGDVEAAHDLDAGNQRVLR